MRAFGISSIFVLLGIFLATLFSSCTSSIKKSAENDLEEDYNIDDFNKINFEGAYNIELTQGNGPSVTMKTTKELHDKVKIWVSDSTLNIKTNVKNISSDEIKINIHFNNLDDVSIKGGALLKNNGIVELDTFNIRIEGGANVDMRLNADKITARAEGAVNMEFQGVADEFNAISEGASNIDADELETRIVDCRVSGVGNASVFATETLNAKVEGLGKISYRGNPILTKKVDGIGVVYKK